jgi:hypothetical protein
MIIKRKSVLTGTIRSRNIPVNPEDMALWDTGVVAIEEAMPYLNDTDREFILSGITTEEWKDAFSQQLQDIVSDVL